MRNKISNPGVIAHIGKEWSTANIVAEDGQILSRTGVLTSMLPRGSEVGDKITLRGIIENFLERVEKRD